MDNNYPENQRNEITSLNIRKKRLFGPLKLEGFSNLTKLYCSANQLTNLDLSKCPNLTEIWSSFNKLTNLDFLNELNHQTLTRLLISNNNFPHSHGSNLLDLQPFSEFTNLETLNISNNSFVGSLAPLRSLEKLRILNIGNTRIDSGLAALPEEKFGGMKEKLTIELKKNKEYNDYVREMELRNSICTFELKNN